MTNARRWSTCRTLQIGTYALEDALQLLVGSHDQQQ